MTSSGQRLPHDWFDEALPVNVSIGEKSWLYSAFAFIHFRSRKPKAVQIGHDTGIYIGTFFDLGPEGEVEIGNYASLVGAIIATNSRVKIGDYALIAHEVVIADSPVCVPGPSERTDGIIEIGTNSWIGANSVLLPGARIGEGAIVGAGSVIDSEVPPFAVIAGNPAAVRGFRRPRQ